MARLPAELVTPVAVLHRLSSSGNSASSRLKPSSSRTSERAKSADASLTAALLRGGVLDEGAGAHVGHRLPELVLGVHHDRAIPCNGLFDRLARDQQEADALL